MQMLKGLPFHQFEKSGELVKEWHQSGKSLVAHPDLELVRTAYAWLFVPLSLRPVDVHGLVGHLLGVLKKGERLGEGIKMVLRLLGGPPGKKAQLAVAQAETEVQQGTYEQWISSRHKYDEKAEMLSKNLRFRDEWRAMKKQWKVADFENRSGVIRRRMIMERGFRAERTKDWSEEKEQFQCAFDAFCQRWDLYGMQKDKPLLLKLSINLTPHGTLMMIPRYWSLDARRDLNWNAISKLHRVHGAQRQGKKLLQNRKEREQEAKKARALHALATANGLRGKNRNEWIMDELGWLPESDVNRLHRLLKEFPE